MPPVPDIATAFTLGLLGGTHCLGMCGGIGAALAFALGPGVSTPRRYLLLGGYNTGRIFGYALLGAAFAGAAGGLAGHAGMGGLRVLAGLLLVAMGCALGGWFNALAPLERAGHAVWSRVQGRAARLLPVDRLPKALLAGLFWGWLPCGLVYSTLAWASASGSAVRGALLMAAFGAGTLPAVLASGVFGNALRRQLQRRGLRRLAGAAVIAFGAWTLAVVLLPAPGGHAHHHG
ncbi:MAG: hypothetical protein CALGDGBN_01165 [Pseudomonadales bacterium]|nr:hypothetical protein [Pseudomonadales bacterium]